MTSNFQISEIQLTPLDVDSIDIQSLEPPSEGDVSFTQRDITADNAKTLIFDSRDGQIIDYANIQLTRDHMSLIKLSIFDERDEFRETIDRDAEVVIELGFHNGAVEEIFKGKIFKIGRQPPEVTIIHAIDELQTLKKQSGSQVQPAGKGAPNQVISTKSEIIDTFEGQAQVIDDESDDNKYYAFHPELESGTQVRITNPSNAKTILAEIKSSLESRGNIVIGVDSNTAKELGLAEDGEGDVKVEVLKITEEKEERIQDNSIHTEEGDKPKKEGKEALAVTEDNDIGFDFITYKDDPLNNLKKLTSEISNTATEDPNRSSFGSQIIKDSTNLRFETNNNVKLSEVGSTQIKENLLKHLGDLSKLYGNDIVAEGDTIKEVAPGQGESTGVVLDYRQNPQVFITRPVVTKKTRFYQHLTALGSGIAITGFNALDKESVGAVVVTPDNNPKQHPTGVIEVPEWSSVNLSDPVISGGRYTWGEATRNGQRIPAKENMEPIVKIAQVIEQFTDQVGDGKWLITDWFRDPYVGYGAARSEHKVGHAVDCWFPSYLSFFQSQYDSWDGGLAEGGGPSRAGEFMHIDLGARGRWVY